MAKKSSTVRKAVTPKSKKTITIKPISSSALVKKITKRAKSVISAYESQTVEQQLTQREDELAILKSVGEAMAKTLDVRTVTRIVGDKVQNIFAAEIVSIRLYDPTTNLIQGAYDYEQGYEDLTDTLFSMGVGLTSKIIESRKPMLLGTYEEQMSTGAFAI